MNRRNWLSLAGTTVALAGVEYGRRQAFSGLAGLRMLLARQDGRIGLSALLNPWGQVRASMRNDLLACTSANDAATATFNRELVCMDAPLAEARRFVEKTAKNGATVNIGFPGMKLTNIQDRYPMEVMTEIVGSNSGWLHELLRGQQLVYYAWGYSFPGLLPGYVVATAQCEADKATQVLGLIQEQLAKAARGEFTEEEVAHAKSNQINAEILEKQTNADAAMTAALDELYGFGYNWSEGYADRIMAVTIADVQNVAKKYLTASPTVTIVTAQPEAFNVPAVPENPKEK